MRVAQAERRRKPFSGSHLLKPDRFGGSSHAIRSEDYKTLAVIM